MSDVTLILQGIKQNDPGATEKLLPLVDEELRRLAAARMAQEAAGQTLQPTALVHEAWLQLVGSGERSWENRAHFFGAAADAMRRILIEKARRKARIKHGGGQARVDIADIELAETTPDDNVLQGRVLLGDKMESAREYVVGTRDRCDDTVMRIRSVRDARYRYLRNFTTELPFLGPNNYKETHYPVWNLLKELHAAGKLTPAQELFCQPRMPEEELYDLQTDPHQIHNLATSPKPEHQAELKRMRAALAQWSVDTGDK